jgi:hypothetical protein
MEMTLSGLGGEGAIVHSDYLSRVDTLRTVGKTVLVSKFGRYFRLVEYLARYTQNKIGIAVGIPSVRQIAEERFYDDLPGGALEAAGRLFRRNVRLYVYPARDPATGALVTADDLELPPESRGLHEFLRRRRSFVTIHRYDPTLLQIVADDVLTRLQKGDPTWEASVPTAVAETIKREGLFGWSGAQTVA